MIKTGIDAVEIERFSKMRNLDGFVKKVFTAKEQKYFEAKNNPCESIAGHYAAKEAFSKYLGSGFRGFSFIDIEVLHDELGKPYIMFKHNRVSVDLSITHSKTIAAAVVCGDGSTENVVFAEHIKEHRKLLPIRHKNMHKGDCGRVFILAGSRGMTGAAALCAEAAMRCGSGLVTVGVPDTEQPVLAVKITEAMTLPLPSENGIISSDAAEIIKNQIEMSDACAIGPGLGKSSGLYKCINCALETGKPILLDADGLNFISEHIDILEHKHGELVLTPHPGEMSRLCGLSVAEIESQREQVAAEFAKRYKVTLLLKGSNTAIASPDGRIHINPTGNNGMASGGMGDVLSGVVASFMGQGLHGYEAAVLGAFVHGLAGDFAANKLGEFGMIAGDVVKQLPYAINALLKS